MSEWHSRGYIPHWEAGEVIQTITFRLADSLPSRVLDQWRRELSAMPDGDANRQRRIRIEQALDRGYGAGSLLDPRIAHLVEDTLLRFDRERYRLHAWSIMPNHVHVIAAPNSARTLSSIVHSWKSFTASKANAIPGRKGAFWAPEYYDRAVRDERHYDNAIAYVAMNPVKAGLCALAEDWRFSSAWRGRGA
jgi:REP element-mobilizing transposase RayT